MNHIKASLQSSQEIQNNQCSLNYSFLLSKMDEEDRLNCLQKNQKPTQKSDKIQNFMSLQETNLKQRLPISSQLKLSLGFGDLNFNNIQALNQQKFTKQLQINNDKQTSKLISSIVKQQQPRQNNQQINEQSLVIQEESESINHSHFKQASLSDSMDDFLFNPPKKEKSIKQQVNNILLNQLSNNLCINVIDSTMKISDKQVFNAEQYQTQKNSKKHSNQLLVSRTSNVQIPQNINLFKGLASSHHPKDKNIITQDNDQRMSKQQNSVAMNKSRMVNKKVPQLKLADPIKKIGQQENKQKQVNLHQSKFSNQIQVPNRMKSTYDQKNNTQFDLLLNQGNFSEPDDHNNKKSSHSRKMSKAVDFQQNITEQDKQNLLKQQILEKFRSIEQTFNNLRQTQRQRYKTQPLTERISQRKGHNLIKIGSQAIIQRRQHVQDFPPEYSLEDDRIYQNGQYIYPNNTQAHIINQLKELRYKMEQIQQQTVRTVTRQDGQKNIKNVQKMKNGQTNKYGSHHITVKNRVKQQKPSKIKVNSNMLTNQDFTNMQSLLIHFKYEISRETSVDDIVEMCFEIIQLFSLHIDSCSPIGLVLFKDFVQIQFQQIGVIINWKYGGQFYIGTCKASFQQIKERQGQGIQLLKNEYIYKGNFIKNKKDGFGMIFHSNGQRYKGNWSNDLYEGKGIKIDDQSTYEGYFLKGMKSKRGIQKFISGDIYEGEFAKGKFHGKGRYLWANSTYYNGSFVQGQMHGYGYWRSCNGDKYEGNYMKNMKHGNGIYVSKAGKILRGKFEFGNYIQYQSKRSSIKQENQLNIQQQQHTNHKNNYKGKHYKIIVQNFPHQRPSDQNQE